MSSKIYEPIVILYFNPSKKHNIVSWTLHYLVSPTVTCDQLYRNPWENQHICNSPVPYSCVKNNMIFRFVFSRLKSASWRAMSSWIDIFIVYVPAKLPPSFHHLDNQGAQTLDIVSLLCLSYRTGRCESKTFLISLYF